MSLVLGGLATLATAASLCISDVLLTRATIHEPRANSTEPSNGLQTRTVPEIIYSCIFTIILCTSYCIRPNLSAPNASGFMVFMRKLNVAFWAVIFPELVICWAYKQWYYARDFSKKYKNRRWTIAHGQFVIMGGFVLYHNAIPVQVLSTDTFTKLLDVGCIDFPSVTEEDIKTKSRAQPLLAAITLLQATWFITQCIVRGARGLEITQLEAITLFFIGVHILLLPAWWHKPLDARGFVRINTNILISARDPLEILHDGGIIDDFARQNNSEGNYLEALWNLEVPFMQNIELSASKIMPYATKLFTDHEQLYTSIGTKIQRGALEVPIFHAPSRFKNLLFRKLMLGLLFALPYLAMWTCYFPSPYHEKVWHIASIVSFTFVILFLFCPFLFCVFGMILLGYAHCSKVILLVGIVSVPIVLVSGARIALIIEAFLCLNPPSTTAQLAVAWTNFIPHIS